MQEYNFTLMLDTGNAAFEVEALVATLREVANRINRGHRDFSVFDSSGNKIGRCEFDPAQKEEE